MEKKFLLSGCVRLRRRLRKRLRNLLCIDSEVTLVHIHVTGLGSPPPPRPWSPSCAHRCGAVGACGVHAALQLQFLLRCSSNSFIILQLQCCCRYAAAVLLHCCCRAATVLL